jgi:hypothetical protein
MAKLIQEFYEKSYFDDRRFILETKIWLLEDKRYPSGVKFSLIFIDTKSGRKVLMDNHHPKGAHIHLDDKEFGYDYRDEKSLIRDFRTFVFQHFGVKI